MGEEVATTIVLVAQEIKSLRGRGAFDSSIRGLRHHDVAVLGVGHQQIQNRQEMTKVEIFAMIDTQCDKAQRWIRARAIADRRGLAQIMRTDHFLRRLKK